MSAWSSLVCVYLLLNVSTLWEVSNAFAHAASNWIKLERSALILTNVLTTEDARTDVRFGFYTYNISTGLTGLMSIEHCWWLPVRLS